MALLTNEGPIVKYTKPVYRPTNMYLVVEHDGEVVRKLGRNEQHVRDWYTRNEQMAPISITWIAAVETKFQTLWI